MSENLSLRRIATGGRWRLYICDKFLGFSNSS
jgi:hypothetical protein